MEPVRFEFGCRVRSVDTGNRCSAALLDAAELGSGLVQLSCHAGASGSQYTVSLSETCPSDSARGFYLKGKIHHKSIQTVSSCTRTHTHPHPHTRATRITEIRVQRNAYRNKNCWFLFARQQALLIWAMSLNTRAKFLFESEHQGKQRSSCRKSRVKCPSWSTLLWGILG